MAMIESSSSLAERRTKISRALRATGVSLLLMVLVYVVIYAASLRGSLIYGVIPFVLAYWLSVVWLAAVAYSPFMAVVAFVGILVPPVVFVVMLLAYSRAKKFLVETASISDEYTGQQPNVRREPTL
jgi:hypothetical protein